MNLTNLRLSLAGLWCLAATLVFSQDLKGQVYVESSQPTAAENLAKVIKGKARIEGRMGQSLYRISSSPESVKELSTRLQLAGFKVTRTEVVPVSQKFGVSINSLNDRLSKAKEQNRRNGGKGFGVSYLGALKEFTEARAYPYQTIDWSTYERAERLRKLMPQYGGSGNQRSLPQNFEYVGPRNLDIPFRIYFGQPPLGGRMNALAYDPVSPNTTFYAGAANGGVWRTTDNGLTWTGLSGSWSTLPVNTICLTDSNNIYAGLGDLHGQLNFGSGIMKSTDAGATWTPIGGVMGNIGVTKIIAVGPDKSVLIAGTGGGTNFYGGIWRSVDGGASWARVQNSTGVFWSGLTASLPDVSGNQILYAAAAGNASPRAFKSLDLGLTWTPLTLPPVVITNNYLPSYDIAASATQRDKVYFLAPGEQRIFRSSDQGAAWEDITNGIPFGSNAYNFSQYFYNYHINVGVLPTAGGVLHDAVYVGNIDLAVYSEAFEGVNPWDNWKSIGGPTWSTADSVLHNDQHSFAIHPTNPNLALIGNDGGVFRQRFNTATRSFEITPVNRELPTHMFYHLDVHPTLDNNILAGTQDNGTPRASGDLSNWSNVSGGDGAYSAINRNNTSIQYSSSQFLTVYKTTDNWATSARISPTWSNETPRFIAPLELNQGNQNQLLAGTSFIWGYDEPTGVWTRLHNNFLALNGITTIESTPDPQRFYIGGNDGELLRTVNGGTTMTSLRTAGLPFRPIRDIDALDSDPKVVLVVLGGSGSSGRLWLTQDADAASPVWTDVSGSGVSALPQVAAHTVVRDPSDPTNKLWVGNDLGVFVTENGGATWMDATVALGLPKVIVHKLHHDPRTSYLYAATYGRGIWRTRIGFTGLMTFTITPSVVSRGQSTPATARVTMEGVSASNRVVTIAATGVPSGVVIPPSVTVLAGATSAEFPISVQNAASTGRPNLTASFEGVSRSAELTITVPLTASLAATPTTVIGGNTTQVLLTLNAPAPAGGSVQPFLSSNPAYATVPATVTLPAGATSVTIPVQTNRVATGGSTILSSHGKKVTLTVLTSNLVSVTATPSEGSAGSGVVPQGRVTLTGAAPTGGVTVTLTSSNPALVTVPASVTVAAGATSATFPITPLASTTDRDITITARHQVATTTWTRICNFRLRARYISSLTLTPNPVFGGRTVTGRVTLSGPAPASYSVVSLTSSSPFAVVPATLVFPAGATTLTFNVPTTLPAQSVNAIITARLSGSEKTVQLAITENKPFTFVFAPSTVSSGGITTGFASISVAAPAGGLTLDLSSSNPTALPVPATLTFPAGATAVSFPVTAGPVTATTVVTVTLTYKGISLPTTVVINP